MTTESSDWLQWHVKNVLDFIYGGPAGNTGAAVTLRQVSTVFFSCFGTVGAAGTFKKCWKNPLNMPVGMSLHQENQFHVAYLFFIDRVLLIRD